MRERSDRAAINALLTERAGMYKTLSIGAVIWDMIGEEKYLGGDSLNVAFHLKKLGVESYYITRLGKDVNGQAAAERIQELGIRGDYIQRDEHHPTGYSKVAFDQNSVPTYAFAEDASDGYIVFSEHTLCSLRRERFDVLWYSSYIMQSPVSRSSMFSLLESSNAPQKFFDLNIRRGYHERSMLERCFRHATIAKMNEEEAGIVGQELYGTNPSDGELFQRLHADFGVALLCVTRGGEGCTIVDLGGAEDIPPARNIAAIDTVGAGDAFSAAFLYAWLEGKPPHDCAAAGNYLGGYLSSRHGAMPEYDGEVKAYFGL